MNPIERFRAECEEEILGMGKNDELRSFSNEWLCRANEVKYSYHFSWMSRPLIQYPQDIVATQELIWTTKPDLIIETGVAHGGSLIFSASMLALLDMSDAIQAGENMQPSASRRRVVGIDIDIRDHNRRAIESHPMASRISMIEGSSIDPSVVQQVHTIASSYERVLVCLDSMHTHAHVLAELEAYAPLTSVDSYCVVFDTIIEDLPDAMFPDRPWSKGDNPKTAVHAFLKDLSESPRNGSDGKPLCFEIDKQVENKLLITVAPDGYLRRVS